jgi:hypothetical protein
LSYHKDKRTQNLKSGNGWDRISVILDFSATPCSLCLCGNKFPLRSRPSSAFSSALIDHDLLSSMKIGTVLYARKDAETTNAGSLGAKAGGRRRTSIA